MTDSDSAPMNDPADGATPDDRPQFPIALISDIHGNVDALHVVLEDIERREVPRIICLGDIVGYGPDPVQCLDLVREKCDFALMGNHDFAVLYEPTNFNSSAEASCFWTRSQFELETDDALRAERWGYLGRLLVRNRFLDALWVHASPRRPINEYIFPDDVFTAPNKMQQIFDRIETRAFCGHTHSPGVFTDEPDFYPPGDLGESYRFNQKEKCIVNPGSVGQPRDRDPRASYAILHEDRVEFFRLEYPIETVANKIKAIPELNDFLGQRLYKGQ